MDVYTKHRIANLFLYPLIAVATLLWLRKPAQYRNFRKLAYKKMYKWQWSVLDYLMQYK